MTSTVLWCLSVAMLCFVLHYSALAHVMRQMYIQVIKFGTFTHLYSSLASF